MPTCHQCHQENANTSTFCMSCGAQLGDTSPPVEEIIVFDHHSPETWMRIKRWLVARGDEVWDDYPFVELESERGTSSFMASLHGTVAEIRIPEGKLIPRGAVICRITPHEQAETYQGAATLSDPPQKPTKDATEEEIAAWVEQELKAALPPSFTCQANEKGSWKEGWTLTPPNNWLDTWAPELNYHVWISTHFLLISHGNTDAGAWNKKTKATVLDLRFFSIQERASLQFEITEILSSEPPNRYGFS